MQLQDCKEQLEEAHKQHEQMVKAMKNDESEEDTNKDKMSPSKLDAMQSELSKVQEEHQAELTEMRIQIDTCQEKLNEAEL